MPRLTLTRGWRKVVRQPRSSRGHLDFWVYKCNSKGHDYQRTWGDWAEVFESEDPQWWGTTRVVPELANAKVNDRIFAYQTDRNELVGLVKVVGWQRDGRYKKLVVKPIESLGVRVRPLKEADRRLARIPALQPGPIRTLYPIAGRDAALLLRAAGSRINLESCEAEAETSDGATGAGFGTPESNKLVERAAIRHVTRLYKGRGWLVSNVSAQNLGFDLVCRGAGEVRHVEVKGASGEGQQFVLTANELRMWVKDKRFVLAFVPRALSRTPSTLFFPRSSMNQFAITPLSFIARRRKTT